MNPEVKQRWVDALESGRFRQGTNALRKQAPDGEFEYCCLGVLLETEGCEWVYDDEMSLHGIRIREDFIEFAILPTDVQAAVGITEEQQYALTNLNDLKRAGFNEIANYIKDNL